MKNIHNIPLFFAGSAVQVYCFLKQNFIFISLIYEINKLIRTQNKHRRMIA